MCTMTCEVASFMYDKECFIAHFERKPGFAVEVNTLHAKLCMLRMT